MAGWYYDGAMCKSIRHFKHAILNTPKACLSNVSTESEDCIWVRFKIAKTLAWSLAPLCTRCKIQPLRGTSNHNVINITYACMYITISETTKIYYGKLKSDLCPRLHNWFWVTSFLSPLGITLVAVRQMCFCDIALCHMSHSALFSLHTLSKQSYMPRLCGCFYCPTCQ